MAKKQEQPEGLQYLKQAIRVKEPGRLYFFYGEEVFLLQHYLNQLRKVIVDELTESFNYHKLNTETFEPILMEEKDILKVLEQGSKFKKWIDEISKYALDEAVNNNKKWKGFKVVEGRVVRRYKDEEAVKIRLLNLSAMEKVVGKNRLSEILGDLIVKPKGKPTLVKEDDKRGKML